MKRIIKNIVVISLFSTSTEAFSQIVIGSDTGSAGANTSSVLLDFPTGENKGIILPYVTTLPSSPTPGTILLDSTDSSAARVKFYNENSTTGTNGWMDLSEQDGDVSSEISFQEDYEEADGKAVIGATESDADGVLVLESKTKAMVLPIVSDVANIPNPSPGMMVYINKSGAKRLAVFNGTKWSFWKP